MKALIGILFATIAATGCATETPGGGESVVVTCAPKTASCADPRLPAVRTTLATLGVDLDHDVEELTLVSVADRADALTMIDELVATNPAPGVAQMGIACDGDIFDGICCFNWGDTIPCFTW